MKRSSVALSILLASAALYACSNDSIPNGGDEQKCTEAYTNCTAGKLVTCVVGEMPQTTDCPEGQECKAGAAKCSQKEGGDEQKCTEAYTNCTAGKLVTCVIGEMPQTTDCPEGQECKAGATKCSQKEGGGGNENWMNVDSDGDTIPDGLEDRANNADSDVDGTPDYLDTDSDNNGIPDSVECAKRDDRFPDTDGDTILDCHDEDNDGDNVSDVEEIQGSQAVKNGVKVYDEQGQAVPGFACNQGQFGSPETPLDCDGDTLPDYLAADSDGDTIPDKLEGSFNSDSDLIFDRYDDDSDNDGLLDKDERGEDAAPRDTDGDSIPDYRDIDSDNDGLSDRYEQKKGLDPYKEDSDGDGASDLIEIGAGTDPNNANDNPQKKGNFVFVTPYQRPSTPEKASLSFATSVQILDLYFAIDRSGSTYQEVTALNQRIQGIFESIRCKELEPKRACSEDKECKGFKTSDNKTIDGVCSVVSKTCIQNPLDKDSKGCIADLWAGLGTWGDCGRFAHAVSLQNNIDKIIEGLTWEKMNDVGGTENAWDAALCAIANATGTLDKQMCPKRSAPKAATSRKNAILACAAGKDTCVGFRDNALRTLIILTDEGQVGHQSCSDPARASRHYTNGSTPLTPEDRDKGLDIGKFARSKNINIIGFWSDEHRAASRLVLTPLIEGNGLDPSTFMIMAKNDNVINATNTAIKNIVSKKSLKITAEVKDIDANASKLIKNLNVKLDGSVVEGQNCTIIPAADLINGKFQGVSKLFPGLALCYDVVPVEANTLFKATEEPQVLKAKIIIKGDGSPLSERIAYFLIPPQLGHNQVN